MTKRKAGFYWHLYHSTLIGWCYGYEGRVAYIRAHKPANEIALRLRLFQSVRGKLPPQFEKVYAAWEKADATWEQTRAAREQAYAACSPELEALHKRECPDCPWDGETIFPKGT